MKYYIKEKRFVIVAGGSSGSGDGASGSGGSGDGNAPSWPEVAAALEAARAVGAGLVRFLAQHGAGAAGRGGRLSVDGGVTCTGARYKVSMCRDLALRAACPRGANCTFAHSEEELER
jgi:RING finger/CCCH-type zinc finger protein